MFIFMTDIKCYVDYFALTEGHLCQIDTSFNERIQLAEILQNIGPEIFYSRHSPIGKFFDNTIFGTSPNWKDLKAPN